MYGVVGLRCAFAVRYTFRWILRSASRASAFSGRSAPGDPADGGRFFVDDGLGFLVDTQAVEDGYPDMVGIGAFAERNISDQLRFDPVRPDAQAGALV